MTKSIKCDKILSIAASLLFLTGCIDKEKIIRKQVMPGFIPATAENVKVHLYDSDFSFFIASYTDGRSYVDILSDVKYRYEPDYEVMEHTSSSLYLKKEFKAKSQSFDTRVHIVINGGEIFVFVAEIDTPTEEQAYHEIIKQKKYGFKSDFRDR